MWPPNPPVPPKTPEKGCDLRIFQFPIKAVKSMEGFKIKNFSYICPECAYAMAEEGRKPLVVYKLTRDEIKVAVEEGFFCDNCSTRYHGMRADYFKILGENKPTIKRMVDIKIEKDRVCKCF